MIAFAIIVDFDRSLRNVIALGPEPIHRAITDMEVTLKPR